MSLQIRDKALQKRYLRIDKHSKGIKPLNQSRLLKGRSDTALLILHGFSASPFEVETVADFFNQTQDMTVMSPLIEGFGSTAPIANQHRFSDWQRGVAEDVRLLSLCYDKIILGGFSLGGAILTDYLLSQSSYPSEILGLFALSPFYDSSSVFLDFLQNILGSVKDSYSYSFMHSMSGNGDLTVILQYPQFYLTHFPMLASKEVIKLGEQIRTKAANQTLTVPFFLSYSQADSVINNKVARLVYNQTFVNRKSHLVYSEELEIPHQITRPEANPYLQELLERLEEFVFRRPSLEHR
jgi:carboxylesterase